MGSGMRSAVGQDNLHSSFALRFRELGVSRKLLLIWRITNNIAGYSLPFIYPALAKSAVAVVKYSWFSGIFHLNALRLLY